MDHPRPGLRYVDADDLDSSTFDFDGIEVVDPAGEKLGVVDGFIIDVNQSRPYHVVVEAGHWYKHKHFLLPIGHVSLDTSTKRLTADVPRSRAERFPGFSRGEFEKLADKEMDQMAYSSVAACCDQPIDQSIGWASWTHYEYPSWWDASYYRGDATSASRGVGGRASATSGISSGGSASGAGMSNTNRDRELVTARGGETSAQAGERAQPGDVIGVESGGEQTHIGDTAKDEDQRRRDAEKSAAKNRG
jgi:hypothetical protein